MIQTIEITSAGGTITLDTTLPYSAYLLTTTGAVTLLASVNVVTNPSPITAAKPIQVYYNGDINLSGNTFTIVGSNINQGLCKQEFKVDLVSDGTTVTSVIDSDDTERPAEVIGTNGLAVATSGTITFTAGIDENYIRVAGTQTASGSVVYALDPTANENDWFELKWDAALTLGANTLTIFGQTITPALALSGNFAVKAWYDGLVWRSYVINGQSGLSALGNLPARTLIGNPTGSSATATTFAAVKDGELAIMDGGILKFNTLIPDSFGTTLFAPQYFSVTIPQASVATSGVTPVILGIPAPGVGLYIHVIDVNVKKNSATAYTGNTDVAVRYTGAANPIRRKAGLLGANAQKYVLQQIGGTLVGSQIIANQTLEFYTETGNPTGTGGDIVVEVFYTIKPF